MTDSYTPFLSNLCTVFGHRLIAAVLFGSQARGESHGASDHDIFVIIEGLSQDPVKRIKEVRKCLLDVDLDINIIAKTRREVESDLTPLMMDICMDGKCLWGMVYFEQLRKKGLKAIAEANLIRERIGKDFFWHFPEYRQKNWELTWNGYHELA